MTTSMRALGLAAALAVGAAVLHAPAGWLAAPAYAKKNKGPGFAAETFLHAAPVATGALRRFLLNPHGEVDALLLADGTIVKFPPHMSRELTTAVKVNDTVSVRGYREAGDTVKVNDTVSVRGYREAGDTIKAFVITNEGSRQHVVEHPPVPGIAKMPKHLRFAALSRLKVAGQVDRAMRGKKGEVNGVLLEDGTVVRFPPHAAFDFAPLLQSGQTVAAEGLGTENELGRGLEATAIGATAETLRPIYGQ